LKSFRKNLLHRKQLSIIALLFYSLIFGDISIVFSSQENYFEELELNNTKDGYQGDNVIPTNPFEIVDKLRRANSMNDATNPSDAIDEAIRSFDNLKLNNN